VIASVVVLLALWLFVRCVTSRNRLWLGLSARSMGRNRPNGQLGLLDVPGS
jgi:hypothetical protein